MPKLGQVCTCIIPIPMLNFKFPLPEHGVLELAKAKAAGISRIETKASGFS